MMPSGWNVEMLHPENMRHNDHSRGQHAKLMNTCLENKGMNQMR